MLLHVHQMLTLVTGAYQNHCIIDICEQLNTGLCAVPSVMYTPVHVLRSCSTDRISDRCCTVFVLAAVFLSFSLIFVEPESKYLVGVCVVVSWDLCTESFWSCTSDNHGHSMKKALQTVYKLYDLHICICLTYKGQSSDLKLKYSLPESIDVVISQLHRFWLDQNLYADFIIWWFLAKFDILYLWDVCVN